MKVAENFANARGPVPGSTKAIPQHKAISEGFVAEASPRKVDLMMAGGDKGKTGGTSAPGLTSKAKPRRMR